MATPRLWIIVVRDTRAVRKHIRGYLAELNDSELSDNIESAEQPAPLAFLGVRNTWQRPVVSAPIPSIGGARLAMWGVWQSVLPQATQDLIVAKQTQFPNLIRRFQQQGNGTGDTFEPTETPSQMLARVKGLVDWIDRPED